MQIFEKFQFFRQFYWLFTAISGQIILFLFKSHHFRTHFLYIIRYNILRPVHDPPATTPTTPPAQNLGGRDPHNPPGLTPILLGATVI